MKKIIFIIILITASCQKKEAEKSILNDCLNDKQVDLLNEMISSFENDICKYYKYSYNESDKAIKEYLSDFKKFNNASFLLKIASAKSKKLLKESFTVLSNDIWVTYLEEYSPHKDLNVYEKEALNRINKAIDTVNIEEIDDKWLEEEIPIHERGEKIETRLKNDEKEREEMIEKYKNKHSVRIYGKLINCIYKKTSNENAKELYNALQLAGRIFPKIFIEGLVNMDNKDFNSKDIKTYIVLEYFYSPLDFNLK